MNTENLFSELVEKISNEVSKQVLEKFTIKTEKLEGTLNELIQALVQEPREPVKNVPKVETVFEAPTKVRKISQKKEKVRILSTPIAGPGRRPTISEQEFASVLSIAKNPDEVIMAFPVLQKMRSEERRVGKEC